MPQSYDPPPDAEMRQRVRDQLYSLRDASDGNVAWDTADPADHNYLFVPGRVLMALTDEDEVRGALEGRTDLPQLSDDGRLSTRSNISSRLISYDVPPISGDGGHDVQIMVDAIAAAVGRTGVVTPEHYVHVAPNGSGNSCPATEPAETGLGAPWPPKVSGNGDGSGIVVAVADCGFVDLQQPPGAQRDLAEYDGHGPFAEAIIRTQAPNIEPILRVEFAHANWTNNEASAGIISEADLCGGLEAAVTDEVDIISISAGCHTFDHQTPKAFEDLWTNTIAGTDIVVVAAAGNECTKNPFYPAGAPWATGVGSLDRHEDAVSDYSNWGSSADVFLLGRNHVNAFPDGRYRCRWTPDKDDERLFQTGWARWSGTSFSTPLLTGYLAAYMSEARADGSTLSNRQLRDLFLASPVVEYAWHQGWQTYYRYISSRNY